MRFLLLLILFPALYKAEVGQNVVIQSLHVVSDIRFRFARTVITSRVTNPTNVLKDLLFHVTLPNTAFISGFRIFSMRENTTRIGTIDERESAKRRYTWSHTGQDPMGYVGVKNVNETNTFEVAALTYPNDNMTFTLTYEEVLQRSHGHYKHNIYIDPGQPVHDMKIDVVIQESRDITTLKIPLAIGTNVTDITEENSLVVIQRPTSKSAYIKFHPTLDQQMVRWSEGISGHFSVIYDVDRGFDAGDVLVSNGFFIHFFAPVVPNPIPKDVLFILDTSTSMFRGKLDQLKAAMAVILKDLNPDDRFNIISFGSRVVFWQKKMAEVKQTTNVQRAIEYLNTLKALGWTNVQNSISKGVAFMNKHARSAEGSFIIFLTDGRPTAGEISHKAILQHIRETNSKDIPIYTLAFGKNANWTLVEKIAVQNFGIGKRIYTDGNAAKQIEDFYKMIANTMLQGVTFKYSKNVSTTTPAKFPRYSEGLELIVTGQVGKDGDLDPLITGVRATALSGGVTLTPSHVVTDLKSEFHNLTSLYADFNMEKMTKKMWAYLYIKELFRTIIVETDEEKRQKLEQEALKLSLEHKLVTPMTSLIVDSPYDKLDRLADVKEDDNYLFKYRKTSFTPPDDHRYDRYDRGGGGWDPHFMVYMAGLKYPICFDVHGEDRNIYQLIRDPQTDLTVNALMTGGKKHNRAYYMREIAMMYHDLHMYVTCTNMTLHGVTYSWNRDYNGTIPGARFFIKNITSRLSRLSIVFDSRLQIDISNHLHNATNAKGQDFLNIELGNEQMLSSEADGLLGQFLHKKMRLEDITYKNGHLVGHLVSRTGLEVERGRAQIVHREDPVWQTRVSCWLIKKMGASLFDGPTEYYIVSDMHQTTLE